jgi:putative chitinase
MLMTPGAFFDRARQHDLLGPLNQGEVDGCNALLAAAAGLPGCWTAYMLATSWHETNGTMQPIDEIGGPIYFKRMYDINGARPSIARQLGNLKPGDGVLYHGRGYDQITGRGNYRRMGVILGLPLEAEPERVLNPAIASRVIREGMVRGLYTSHKLADYLPAGPRADAAHYVNARRIINGTDCADDIALHAHAFEDALVAGGWA